MFPLCPSCFPPSSLQSLLGALSEVGKRHGVSIADVACRWVLDRPQVPALLRCLLPWLLVRHGGAHGMAPCAVNCPDISRLPSSSSTAIYATLPFYSTQHRWRV